MRIHPDVVEALRRLRVNAGTCENCGQGHYELTLTCSRCDDHKSVPTALGSLPVPAQEELKKLIASWRTMRRAAADVGFAYVGGRRGYEAAGVCQALERCADELSAVLSRSAQEDKKK